MANIINFPSGKVGIGTENPQQTLDIAGTLRLSGSTGTGTTLMARNASGDVSAVTIGAGLNLSNNSLTATGGGTGTVSGSGTATQVAFWGGTTGTTSSSLASSANLYWDNVNGRLGVGITTPTSNLDVVGSVKFQNPTTAYDGPNLGTELLTTGTGTNWTGTSFATGYLHATGSTVALVAATSPANSTYYQIVITTTGRTAGSFTFSFGGYTSAAISADGTTIIGPLTTSTSPLTITPTTDFNGTVSATIKSIGSSSAVFKLVNSSGTTVYEQRAGNNDINMFLGRNAGFRNTTGTSNLFVGNQAGQNNTTASYNTFIGNGAGTANVIGESNLFIGAGAGGANRTGSSNFFMGRSAGLTNTVGNNNLAIGTLAGVFMVSGNSNVYLGGNAGYNNSSGSNNVLIGSLAGRFYSETPTADTSINNSIFIGTDTRSNLVGQTNQIIIANSGRGLGSNTTVLGNTSTVQTHLHGSLTLGSTTSPAARMVVTGADDTNSGWTAQFHNSLGNSNSLMIRNDGNVGIGTSGTTARFVVRASGSSTGSTAMLVENSGGTSMLMVREDGNVGIGTNAPSFSLEVVGRSRIGGDFNLSTNDPFFVTGSRTDRKITNTFTGSITSSVGYFGGTVDVRGSQAFTGFNGMLFSVNNQNTSGSNNITAGNFTVSNDATNAGIQSGTGVVGRFVNISNVAASNIRCVQGDVVNLLTGSTINNLYLFRADLGTNDGSIVNTYGFYVGNITKGTQANTPFSFYASDADALNYFAGRTGIGTTTPAARLHVVGSSTGTTAWTAEFHNSGGTSNSLMIRDDGNIGVNTDAPLAKFYVRGADTSDSNWTAQFHNSLGTSNSLMIRNDGNVGIGTDAPAQTLDVAGTMRLTGSTGTGTTLMARNADGDVSAVTVGSGLNLANNTLTATGGGTVSGSGTATQVAFWDNTTSLAGNSNLFWDNVNSRLGVGITTPTSNLDVVGTVEFQNPTTAFDGGVLGSELLTTGTGTNWTGSGFATGYLHATGSTVALVSSASISNGQYYQVVVTVSGRTTGSITFSIGGYTSSSISTNTTTTVGPKTTSTDAFTVTPTTDFNGTVIASVKVITNGTVTFVGKNSAGTTAYEERYYGQFTNMSLGAFSGTKITTGFNNTLLGYQAGIDVTTGNNNVFLGYRSGFKNTIGDANMFIGNSAGFENLSGRDNAFIGGSAGYGNTTGIYNVAIGSTSLRFNTTGSSNIAIGYSAGYFSTGSSNVFIGISSGNNTTSNNNLIIGTSAGLNNTTGGNNVILGTNAGRNVGTGSTNATIISNSIMIGLDSRPLGDNQSNQIVIGYEGRGLGSNTTVLGNTSTVQTHLHGNLTLGSTNAPTARMVVIGSGSSDTGWTAQFHNVLGNSNSLMIRDDGNVGIGTSAPSARLVIRGSGDTSSSSALIVQNSATTEIFKITNDGAWSFSNSSGSFLLRGGTDSKIYYGYRTTEIPYITSGAGDTVNTLGRGLAFTYGGGTGNRPSPAFIFRSDVNISYTTDTGEFLASVLTFNPTSGSGILNVNSIKPTINQTGGASGTTRGLYVNPTLNSAADWRSIEWNNSSGYGLYGAGAAPNYLAGAVGIGAIVDGTSGYNLRVTKQFTTVATARGIISDSQITAGPSTVTYIGTTASASATANVSNLRHYYAAQSTFTSGSVITNQIGFDVAAEMSGATNNYAFYGRLTSGTGRWNLYMGGTATNYLAGSLGIGTDAPAQTLHVAGTMRLTGSTGTGTTLMARNANGDVSAVTLGTGVVLSNNVISVALSPKAETPSGLVNGSNITYTLASTPIANESVMVFLNGVAQYNGIDYTVSGTTITFGAAPANGSSIFAYYMA